MVIFLQIQKKKEENVPSNSRGILAILVASPPLPDFHLLL
jgi:hypothetical protein